MKQRKLRLGVAGLGRAFTLMLPTFVADARVALVAGADPRGEARRCFAADFNARTYETVEELCRDTAVEAVYVPLPNSADGRWVNLVSRPTNGDQYLGRVDHNFSSRNTASLRYFLSSEGFGPSG